MMKSTARVRYIWLVGVTCDHCLFVIWSGGMGVFFWIVFMEQTWAARPVRCVPGGW